MFKFLIMALRESVLDSGKGGYHRLYSLPFLLAAVIIGFASGVYLVWTGESVIELVMTLAGIGITLYGGGKYLSLKNQGGGIEIKNDEEGER